MSDTADPRAADPKAPATVPQVASRNAIPRAGAPRADHHRDVQGGAARAAVFGISDGLLTNVSLILGVAAAHPAAGIVRLTGIAGLLAGSCSMAAGEYLSMSAQVELIEHEVGIEREEQRKHPESEKRELVNLYVARGLDQETAQRAANAVHRDPEMALDVHVREELGVSLQGLGSPQQAALSSFVSFGLGAIVPLLPWFFTAGTTAVLISIALGAVTAIVVGALLAHFTGRSKVFCAVRQLGLGTVSAVVVFGIVRLLGINAA